MDYVRSRHSLVSQTGLRYIPELTLKQKINSGLNADVDLSLNAYATESLQKTSTQDTTE